jgi:hypothetical protein
MTTTGNKLEDRLKEESGESLEYTTGIPIDGSIDPTGEYPRRYNWFGTSISQAARGIKYNSLWVGGSSFGINYDIAKTSYSIFPFNNANETPSGHSIEVDDTPGGERVLIKHHTGAGVELKQDGSVVVASRANRIEVVGADHNMMVNGQGNIVYDGDLNLTVNGNYNLTVNGTYNIEVGANQNHSVNGTYIQEVGDTHQTLVRGNVDRKVWGDIFDFTASEHKIVTKKDLRMIAGNDIIPNAKRGIRMSAEKHITTSSGGHSTFSAESMHIIGRKGKIGGENFHFFGSLFTGGGEDYQGKKTVFHGNLVGRALEAWTAKYSHYAEHSSSAHYSNLVAFEVPFSSMTAVAGVVTVTLGGTMEDAQLSSGDSVTVICSTADGVNGSHSITGGTPNSPNPDPATATSFFFSSGDATANGNVADGNTKLIHTGGGKEVKSAAKPSDIELSPMCITPDYAFNWGWEAKDNHAIIQSMKMDGAFSGDFDPDHWRHSGSLGGIEGEAHESAHSDNIKHEPLYNYYGNPTKWWEVWNKASPYAVRKVYVDNDDTLENKIAKIDSYSYYFNWTPTTAEIRSKMRTMDGANDRKTAKELQTNAPRCIESLLDENRISELYSVGAPPAPYVVKRTAQAEPTPRFGYTLLGNPVERASKTFLPKNKEATERTILADPLYNPDKRDTPITSSTKLSKSCTISKFLGAPGSRASLEFIPIKKQRQDLARQWYLHAWLMEGIADCPEFKNYRLQVSEGYYNPANGIRRAYKPSKIAEDRYWREPYRKEDGGTCQESIVLNAPYINELKYQGRAVVYTLYNSRGKIDYSATFDLALYIRDTFFYDQLSLDYDMLRPDKIMSQQLIVVMPEIKKDFKANFEMKVCTYFNRQLFSAADLVEIVDKDAVSGYGAVNDTAV